MDLTISSALLAVDKEQTRIQAELAADAERKKTDKAYMIKNATYDELKEIVIHANKGAFKKQEAYDVKLDTGDWRENPYFTEVSGSVMSKSTAAFNTVWESMVDQLFVLFTLQMYSQKFMRTNPHGPRGTFRAAKIRKNMEQSHHSPTSFNAYMLDLFNNIRHNIRMVTLAITGLQIRLGDPNNSSLMDLFCLRMLAIFREVCGGSFMDVKPVISPMEAAAQAKADPGKAAASVNGVSSVALCPRYVCGNNEILMCSIGKIPAFVDQYISAVGLMVLLVKIQQVFESIKEAREDYATNKNDAVFRADHGLVYNQFFDTFDPFFVRNSNVLHFNSHVRAHRALTDNMLDIINSILSSNAWGKKFNKKNEDGTVADLVQFDSSKLRELIGTVTRSVLLRYVACHFIRTGKNKQATAKE